MKHGEEVLMPLSKLELEGVESKKDAVIYHSSTSYASVFFFFFFFFFLFLL